MLPIVILWTSDYNSQERRESIKRIVYVTVAVLILFFTTNLSAFAIEKYNFNIFSDCEKVYCDVSSKGAFAFGYRGNTIYIHSFATASYSYSFIADGGFVGVPFLNEDNVCAVYMTNDFKYHILQINCFSGKVSYVNSDMLNDFNYNDIAICNNRLYVLKTDDVYSYVSSYSFDGKRFADYRFSEANVNKITGNSDCVYAFLYDGAVYKLTENEYIFCNKIRNSTDFYNCGVDFIADSNGYIYSLTENKEYTYMCNKDIPFAVGEENIYYYSFGMLYQKSLNSDYIKSYKIDEVPDEILCSFGKVILIFDNYSKAFVINDTEFQNVDFNTNIETKPTDSNISDKKVLSNDDSIVFTDDGLLCNVKLGTTVSQLKRLNDSITDVTDINGNTVSGKLKTGYIAVTNNGSFSIAVAGDVTGSGTISSNDIKLIMQIFTDEKEIFSAYKKAADYNLDGSVDNKDLVLIAREKGN